MGRGTVNVSFEALGLDEVTKALAGDYGRQVKNAARRSFTKLARETRDNLKAKTPKGATGNLKRATKSSELKGGGAKVYIDRHGGRSGSGYHFFIVDRGTAERRTKAGKNRGKMPARNYAEPVLQRARREFEGKLVPTLRDELVASIEKALNKGGR